MEQKWRSRSSSPRAALALGSSCMESVLSMELDKADQSQLLPPKEEEEEADKASDLAITANLVTGGALDAP